jgi:hypothetical protein
MLVYSPHITYRLRYTLDVLLKNDLGLEYEITTHEEEFISHKQPKLSYGYKTYDDAVCIGASGLLFEKGIRPQQPVVFSYEGVPVFFETHDGAFDLPFDLLSASFFLLSRYEEYLPFQPDVHGRFQAEKSFQYQHHFLDKPVVDHYVLMLRDVLQKKFSQLHIKKRKFRFTPTYDIDSAYAHKNKGLVRNTGSLLLSLYKGNYESAKNLIKVLCGVMKDPFDNYDLLHALHREFSLKPIFFFLLGDYDEYDKNISIHISEFKTLIKSIADVAEVGIHPSYASNAKPEKVKLEIERLSKILNRDITKSRQHFLKLNFPNTYRTLIENGITDDYSMGFSSQPGFRAGYTKPYPFYDLEKEMKTALTIHPFAFMDATFQYYHEISPQQALTFILPLVEHIKSVGGDCISLSHNASFFDTKKWAGWTEVYKTILKTALS